jgi:LPS-assembly protein
MLRRLFLVILPALTVSVSFANEAAWNCEQNKETKEWLCIGDAITKTKAQEPAPLPKSVEAIQPAITKPIEIPQPIQASKPVIAEPIVEPAEEIQAALPETTSPPPLVAITEPVQSTQVDKPNSIESDKIIITPPVEDEKPNFFASPNTDLNNKIVPGSASNQPGWNCGANKADGTWNCQQIGPHPESRAQLATTEEPGMRLLDPPFDFQQEQSFNTLTSQLPYDPWQNCNAERGTKQDFLPQSDKRDVAPMDIKSNYAEVYDSEIRTFTGDVQMSRADQQSTAKAANYDSVSDVLDLNGNVFYHDEGVAMHSESAMLNLASDQAKLRDVQFISPTTPLRGKAQAYYRESKTLSNYKDVAYTSCRPGNQDWVIHASDLEMDKVSGKGTAKHTWLEFKGLPVFYSPMLSFPIDNRRQSGFLAPSFGSTKYSGFRVAAPYYWNIAPNYDATFTPRELSKRGPLFSTLFRHMNEQSQSKVGVEFMPYDSELKTTRYLGSIQNSTTITPNINSNLDLNYVSDQTYFAELGNALSFANINYLKSSADVSYHNQDVDFTTAMVNYQSINTTISDAALPYRTLPRVNLNLNHEFKSVVPLVTNMENEYVYFQQSNLVNGQRMHTRPSISTPLTNASSFFTPKLSLDYTQYALNNITSTNLIASGITSSNASNSISRTLPVFSADSGLFFERDVNIANGAFTHTLEPRLFYLYIPTTNQSNIPVFDSAQYDFQYGAMFRENSFSGTDRIQNANQVTTALTSRLIDSSGLERLNLNVGEIFYFQDRQVALPSEGVPNQVAYFNQQSYSNVVTDLTSQLSKQISFVSGMQWNPVRNDFERLKAGLHYRTETNTLFNARYYNRKNPLIPYVSPDIVTTDIQETDLSARFPIYDNWSLMGRWQYSLLLKKSQDTFFGIEKENCCWRFRVALRRYINNISPNTSTPNTVIATTPGTPQNGIFFEFELKGITSIGDAMDEFLGRELYGYKGTQQ